MPSGDKEKESSSSTSVIGKSWFAVSFKSLLLSLFARLELVPSLCAVDNTMTRNWGRYF